jgi:ArsR family transcriptional regulator, zinc-responsive transcriptional repressor
MHGRRPSVADARQFHEDERLAVPRPSLGPYEEGGQLLRALTAPIRLAVIDLLADHAYCVHELVDALGVPQPLVSQHLRVLRGARLVSTRRRGREMVYELVDPHVAHIVRDAVAHASESPGGRSKE